MDLDKYDLNFLDKVRIAIKENRFIVIHRGSGVNGNNKWSVGFIENNTINLIYPSLLKLLGFRVSSQGYISMPYINMSQSFHIWDTIKHKLNIKENNDFDERFIYKVV